MDISSWWGRLFASEHVSGLCSSVVAEVEICAVFKDQLRLKAALWTGPGAEKAPVAAASCAGMCSVGWSDLPN